jgi:hypothetical protein
MEVVDLTEESVATAPLPKPFGVGDVIDLTDDSETPASFSNTPVNRSARDLSYRAQTIQPQHHPYLPQYPLPQQYPAVYDDPVPYQPYSSLSLGSSSRLHSNTQRYSNEQQYPQPHQYAHTPQGQLPQPSPYPGFSVPPGFEAAYGRLTTGTSNGKDRLDIAPGAQSKPECSLPTHSPVDNSVHNSTDPLQSFHRGHEVSVPYAFDARDLIYRTVYPRAESPPSLAKRAQEQAGSENGTLDPHAARALLRFWAGKARKVACSGCSNPMLANMSNLNFLFKKWVEGPTMNISSVISCDQPWCTANTCLGCGQNCRTTGPAPAQDKDASQLHWCCDAGRMVLLWILLCGTDKRKSVRRRRGEYFANLKSSKSSNVSGAGVGYGSHTAYGAFAAIPHALSYGVYGTLENSRVSLPQPAALPTAERADDDVTSRVMACLDNLLPSLAAQNASSFDLNPPAHLLAVLTQSSILGTIAALLRNDSLEDATQRIRLYQNTLNVVDKLSGHPATADLTVNQARQESSSPTDILSLSYLDPDGNNTDKYEETDSLASCLHNLEMASKSILARAKAHPRDFVGQDSDDMLSLYKRVSSTADSILASNAKRSPSLPEQPATATPKTNNDWQSELAVLELEDDVILTRHTHASEAQSASNVVGGRMKSLSIQLSNLTTSVPPGVFVRYCSSRLDVMKILIIGPKGTPYENGLFEFDMFCPPSFPNVPPKMKFRTTGGGRVRFNPNLYNDGKGMHKTLHNPSTIYSETNRATNSLPLPPRHLGRPLLAPRQIHHPANPRLHPGHDLLRRALVQRARQSLQRRRFQSPQPRTAGPHCQACDAELVEARRGFGLGGCGSEAFRGERAVDSVDGCGMGG